MPEKTPIPHSLTIDNRSDMSVTGVVQVISYDENHIVLKTDYGKLYITGRNLVAGEISNTSNILKLSGEISALQYRGVTNKNESLFKRLTK